MVDGRLSTRGCRRSKRRSLVVASCLNLAHLLAIEKVEKRCDYSPTIVKYRIVHQISIDILIVTANTDIVSHLTHLEKAKQLPKMTGPGSQYVHWKSQNLLRKVRRGEGEGPLDYSTARYSHLSNFERSSRHQLQPGTV
jgi:hypothetical protein